MERQTFMKSTLCLLMALVCNVAWAQTFVLPEAGKYYKIKGQNANKPWLTNRIGGSNGGSGSSIVVSAEETEAGIFQFTAEGHLLEVSTNKYIALLNGDDVASLQSTANPNKLIIGGNDDHNAENHTKQVDGYGTMYTIKINNNKYMYNNNTDGIVHEGGGALLGESYNRYWGFIEVQVGNAETFTPVKQTTAPEDGYYLMYSESTHGNEKTLYAGWVHYNASLDRKYRVATDVNFSNGLTANQAKYVWKLVNDNTNSTFTLQNVGEGVFMPADGSRGENMGATTTANLAIEAVGDDGNEGKWFVSQKNNTYGGNSLYIHANTPGGYPNLSYWDGKAVDGTSIRAQFYKVDMPETTYTINYLLEGEQVATTSLVYPTDITVPEVLIKKAVPDGYYMVSSALTENIYTVNIALDIRPVPGKKYYIFNKHQAGYQYYYDNEGNVGFADACNYNDKTYIWLCEANGDKLSFKNVSTNKYFGWKALSNSAYAWEVSSEKGDGKVKNDGCVTLKNSSNTYLVGKVGKVFDQASGAGFDNATFSSDFCFVEYTHKPQPGKYYYFYNKHLKGDKYFYDNNGSVGFSATKEAFNKNYIWLCEEDANNPGMVTFKNLGTDRYFAWQGLSTTALAWTVDETVGNNKVVNEGCVTLTANQSGSNVLVVKNATGWDQSSNAGYYTDTYSSDYCFEEFSELPQDGQTYFIYNDNDTPLYLSNNGGSLKASDGKVKNTSYLFVCHKYGDVYYFRNLAGKWLAHKALTDTRHGFNVATEIANNFGCATLWTGGSTSRYFCIKKDGTLDHAQGAFNKASSDFSTDFVFEPCREKTISLTINVPSYAKATLNINGVEYNTFPAKVSFFPTVAPGVSISHINHGFEFVGYVDTEGNPYDLANLATITENTKLTAKYNAVFFSSTYGEKWVRLQNCSNNTYWATTDGSNGKTAALDYTDTKQLWCLVGDAESFVLYNMAVGDQKALKVNAATYANGSAATIANDLDATWKLKSQDFGHALVPTQNTNSSELGINMYGGNGGDLKLFTTGNTNTGSYWIIEMADVANSFTYGAEVIGTAWDGRHGVADITFTVNGTTCKTHHIEGDLEAKTYYLPKNAVVKFSSRTFRGYTLTTLPELDNFGNFEGVLSKGGAYEFNLTYTANEEKVLYYTPDANGKPYRIPAIAAAPNGHIFAIADNRPCGNDIGYGEVDIKCRISKDNGATWSDEFFIANGLGELPFLSEEDRNKTGEELNAAKATVNNMHIGFGDAAVVADRESNKLLVMMVAGRTVCHNGRWDKTKIGDTTALAVNRVARVYAEYDETAGEWKWTDPEEVTDHMYSIFLNGETPTVTSMFIGSGKICQSRVVKKDQYYRLYCAIWTRDGGNRVIYSDDFGGTWNVLGTIADRPAPNGDEPKCEELPDGTVVLSSRVSGGRFFNLFTFNNDGTYTTGSWGTVAKSTSAYDGSDNGTNGEIYKVKAIRKKDGKICDVMLQSIPAGPGRTNVKVYYKEMEYNADGTNKYTPADFAADWKVGKHVSNTDACYSTMILQADGRIAFLFEEAPGGYCIVYIPYTIEDLTGGAYTSIGAPTTGYYYMISKATDRHEHLYNNALHTGNSGRTTLQSDTKVTTNNGIWHITNLGDNNIGIKNGDGNPIVAKDGSLAGAYSELIIGDTNIANDYLYYYFSNAALNCSRDKSINGINYLTTWQDGGPSAADNQWRFEPVSVEGKTIYEVVVDGDANAYVTYDNGTTVQNAFNGGFFITDGAITGAQLSAGILNNEFKNEPTITIEGTTITLSGVKPLIVKQDLYNTSNGSLEVPPYRIPGITVDPETGRIITTAARLVCGTDPGYGQVDVVCRISDDNGENWSGMKEVAVGTGITSPEENYFDTAFGDPAVVADRTSDEVLIIVVAGCTKYQTATREIPNEIGTIHSLDNGKTWGEPVRVTEQIYSLFDAVNGGNTIQSAFVGGGKIFQSRIVKVGNYYRLYAAMCARPNGNRVIYSDDFGRTWKALGGAAALPAPGGDEPKCEELPDGRVVLSSRVGGGRIYNFYTYSNTTTAEGEWGTSVTSTFEGSGKTHNGQSTNGEILIVPVVRNSDGKDMYLVLQSLPTGGGRSNVGIFYKELTDVTDINTVANFATDWNGFYQVSYTTSAYSSMDLQNDNRIGFIYEENYTKHGEVSNPHSVPFPDASNLGTHNYDGYDNIYVAYPLEIITNNAYSIKGGVDRREFLRSYFTDLTAYAVDEVKAAVAANLEGLSTVPTIGEVDNIYFTISKGSAVTAFDEHAGKAGFFTSEAVATYKTEVMAATQPEGLAEAKAKLLASKLNIVSGKAYTFKNVQKDGTTVRWYKYDTEQGKIVLTATEDEATPFVCRLLENGKYVFVCNGGKYMTWRASVPNYTDGTGVNDAYHGEGRFLTDITIAKMTSGGQIASGVDLSNTRYVSISAKRPDKDETGFVVVKKNNGSPVFDGAGDAYYNDSYSSAFIMEEAPFGNAPEVNSVGGSDLVSDDLKNAHMSTFSATYATVAPEGVTAYYATKEGDNVVLNAIAQGKAIPAYTGVILVSEEAGNAVMLSAAGETAADVTGNLMGHSAGAAKDMSTVADAYILTGGTQGAGFYRCTRGTLAANKAYLVLPQQAVANAPSVRIRLAGTQGGTTEIEGSELKAQGSQLIYDLQGRRVLNPTKGMYIVNGKKVIF